MLVLLFYLCSFNISITTNIIFRHSFHSKISKTFIPLLFPRVSTFSESITSYGTFPEADKNADTFKLSERNDIIPFWGAWSEQSFFLFGFRNISDGHLGKCNNCEKAIWKNCKLGKPLTWENYKLEKLQVGKNISWENLNLEKLQVGKIANWENRNLGKI